MRASEGTNCFRNFSFFISLHGPCDIALIVVSGPFLLLALPLGQVVFVNEDWFSVDLPS